MKTLTAPVLKIAPPYDQAMIRYIEQEFEKRLHTAVRFEVIEDSSLLCGFIAYIQGVIYDVSGKKRLTDINAYILNSLLIPLVTNNEGTEDI
ncbi:MAG: F0F1 ATP synthase subunit delta [Lachnospiraceae bacterium]